MVSKNQTVYVPPAKNATNQATYECEDYSSSEDEEECQENKFRMLMDPKNTGKAYFTFSEINMNQMLSGFLFTAKVNLNGNAMVVGETFDQLVALGQIVDLDYKDYVIMYSCIDYGEDMKNEKVLINVRDPNISNEKRQTLLNIAKEKISKVQYLTG